MGTPEPATISPERLPQILDPTAAFREMGLIATAGPLPLIGSVRAVAGPTPDTALALISLSLRNRGLAFRREGDVFLAEYRVEIGVRRGPATVAHVSRNEQVRVITFRETQRSDESVIFQQFVPLAPGAYVLSLSVRDRGGPNATSVDYPFTVPSLRASSVSPPIAVYQGRPRATLAEAPLIVANPRVAVEYGADTLRFYVEAYALREGTALVASASDAGGRVAWVDTLRIESGGPVRSLFVAIPPQSLSIGRYDLRIRLDGNLAAEAPFLVTFSDLYAAANLEEIVSLLRFFPEADSLRAILNAPPEERGAAWQRFWRRTDPNPATPEHEAIDLYLRRVQLANQRFTDEGVAGWLTDRGEVFITLGEPDEYIDRRTDIQGRGRYIVWSYYEYRISLTFVDDGGFGRYRLDPRSRSEYLRILNRIRRQ